MSESVLKPPGGSPAGPPPESAVAGQQTEDPSAQAAPHQVAEVKVQALEALNSAFCQHIYSTALQYLKQNYNMDTIGQQFMEILDKDDPYDSPCSVANHSVNSAKNRYRDVVPYDHNRVALPPLVTSSSSNSTTSSTTLTRCVGIQGSSSCYGSTTGDSSYINASFMSDPRAAADNSSQATGYIATQGPLPNTVADFWRMVSATNTSAIVMLTGLTDGSVSLGNSRPRCAAYFPDEEQDRLCLPGNITVTCVHKNNLDENVFFRQLEVVWAANPQQQRLWINHYQYSAWPDYGVPQSTHSVLALCHALDGCRRAGCKIVAHCSAGVGRTGTFVAIDMLLQRLHTLTMQLHGSVKDDDICAAMDIAELVISLRKQRRGTVQTGEQYAFIWQVLVEELELLLQQEQQEQQMLQQATAGMQQSQ